MTLCEEKENTTYFKAVFLYWMSFSDLQFTQYWRQKTFGLWQNLRAGAYRKLFFAPVITRRGMTKDTTPVILARERCKPKWAALTSDQALFHHLTLNALPTDETACTARETKAFFLFEGMEVGDTSAFDLHLKKSLLF